MIHMIEVVKPILLRYDNDHVKVYAPRLPSKAAQQKYINTMERAQSDALMGRVELEEALDGVLDHLLSEITDELGTEKAELGLGTRGYRWDPDKWGALSLGKLNRRYKRARKYKNKEGEVVKVKRVIPKYYYTFDKSLVNNLEGAGVGGNTTRMLAKLLIKKLRRAKKAILDGSAIKSLVTRAAKSAPKLKGKEQEVVDALNKFSVVKGAPLQESVQLDRWKTLAGIKGDC